MPLKYRKCLLHFMPTQQGVLVYPAQRQNSTKITEHFLRLAHYQERQIRKKSNTKSQSNTGHTSLPLLSGRVLQGQSQRASGSTQQFLEKAVSGILQPMKNHLAKPQTFKT